MIVKSYERSTTGLNRFERAGAKAEEQMAHYLNRSFREDSKVQVLHGLRIEDSDQPEQNGSPGVCQIDHLLVHRWGMFIVESKSVTEEIRVRPDGSGGDEWTRLYHGEEKGMGSPIQQAERQSEFLRRLFQRHHEDLMGKLQGVTGTIRKAVTGSDQRTFKNMPIQLVVAISDKGIIRRAQGWKEPQRPFRVIVSKADLVPGKIEQELKRHRKGSSLFSATLSSSYGLWNMESQEAMRVAKFLAVRHRDRLNSSSNLSSPSRHDDLPVRTGHESVASGHAKEGICKHCLGSNLSARSGKYGYYWRCLGCGRNTRMPIACSNCGAQGERGDTVRIRKNGTSYFRDCSACGTCREIWTEA